MFLARRRPPVLWITISLMNLIIPVLARSAANETPGRGGRPNAFSYFNAIQWEQEDWVVIDQFKKYVVKDQHYRQGAAYVDPKLDLFTGTAGVGGFLDFCTTGAADVMAVASHGNSTQPWGPFTLIEVYPPTAAGLQARDTSFTNWAAQLPAGAIFKRDVIDSRTAKVVYYSIAATQTFYDDFLITPRAFCWWATCLSARLQLTKPGMGRCFVGYYDVVSEDKAHFDAVHILRRMDGLEGKNVRPLLKASFFRAPCTGYCIGTLETLGELRTVLSPAVTEYFPRSPVCGQVGGSVTFDCKMDRSVDPAAVVQAEGDAVLTNHRWLTDDEVTFTVLPFNPQPVIGYTVRESAARSDGNAAHLDGNLKPRNTDAVGPNQDDFVWGTNCPRRAGVQVAVIDPLPTEPGDPGESNPVFEVVSNESGHDLAVTATLSDSLGWITPQPLQLAIPTDSLAIARWDVPVPADAQRGAADHIHLVVTGAGNPVQASGQIVVEQTITGGFAGLTVVGAGVANPLEIRVQNRSGNQIHATNISVNDQNGWSISTPTTDLVLDPEGSAVVEVSLTVPSGTAVGTQDTITLQGQVGGDPWSISLPGVTVGLPVEITNESPVDIVPGNQNGTIALVFHNRSSGAVGPLSYSATDMDGHVGVVQVNGPSSLPANGEAPGSLILNIPANPSLIGASGTVNVRISGSTPGSPYVVDPVPYSIEPAIEIIAQGPYAYTGSAQTTSFPWPVSLRNRSDIALTGTVGGAAGSIPVQPPSVQFTIPPNATTPTPFSLLLPPDFPAGAQTADLTVATQQGTGDTDATYNFMVQTPVAVNMMLTTISGFEGDELPVGAELTNLRADHPMTGTITWTDARNWIEGGAQSTPYTLLPGRTDTLNVSVRLPYHQGARDTGARVDSDLVSIEVTMTYDTGTPAQADASIPVSVLQRDPARVHDPQAPVFRDAITAVLPNPSEGDVHILFALSSPKRARVSIFDTVGRKIATVVDANLAAGYHEAVWSGRTGADRMTAGVYFARLETGSGRWTGRIVRLR